MPNSVFVNSGRREIFGNKLPNGTSVKRLPDIGVEYFECRSTQAFRLHSMLDINSPPFSCDFSPKLSDLILIAQEDGLVHLYDTSLEGMQAFLQDYEAHANAVFDVKWLVSGTAFLTASGDQSIRLIDAEEGVILQQFFGHTMSVRSLALMPNDSQIFASASRDGSIRLWDLRLKSDTVNFRGIPGTSSVGLLSQCHLPNWSTNPDSYSPAPRRPRTPSRRFSSDAQSVTSVVFMNDNTLLSAGSTDGSIKMWDLRRVFSNSNKKEAKPKCVLPYRGVSQKRSGYSDLQLDSLRTRLYANCLDNVVYEYDLTRPSTSPIFVYAGHQTDSFYIKLDVSPDDNFIVCGSSDRRAYIYAVGQRRQRPVVLSGHNGEVSVPRWCRADPSRVVTLSDDSRAFVWNMFPARQVLLPQPGELAGLAERLSPSKAVMSPSEQIKRVLRSPRSTSSRPLTSSDPANTAHSPSLASARRRQSNIREFLSVFSPPDSTQSVVTTSPSLTVGCPLRARNMATLTETLGSVVQRFPGLSVGFSPNPLVVTPPLGCYAMNLSGKGSRSPGATKHHRILSPEYLYSDQSDIENCSPERRALFPIPADLPLDFVDGPVLTKSPIVCCTAFNTDRLTPNTPASARKRNPLVLQQALFHTPPSLHTEKPSPSNRTRKRTGPTGTPPAAGSSFGQQFAFTDKQLLGKRRRLTVYGGTDSRTCDPQSTVNSPSTPTSGRRRRMTSVLTGPRFLRPITKYFKSEDE
ncbi:Denticleless protein [Paragonimus heterotremus]|uniref:Denticleless protein n=1 Tax=Paragonimus heterotremus TaxID=100268 RepID=A0A8J4WKG1_9TREM|nr:Denticleless protein [Paragonimus heterotremus]